MPLNRESFAKFEERLIETLKGKTALLEVPYYICLYHPKDELDALECFNNMVFRLNNKGFSAEVASFSQLMLDGLSESGLLSPEILGEEEQKRGELERSIRNRLPEQIVEALKERLENKDVGHCAVLLRIGALYPFVHLKYILQSIDNSVHCTLVIPYPSDIGTGHILNEISDDSIEYYRAEVVDLK